LILSQCFNRPERYAELSRFDTMPSPAGLLIDNIAVADVVLVECQARIRPVQQPDQRLLARLDRQLAQILAVEFEQVEGAEHGRVVVAPGPQQLEHREPGLVGNDGFAVDQAGVGWQCRDGGCDQGKGLAEIVAITGVEPHVRGVTAR
jgi:hypothetical protein